MVSPNPIKASEVEVDGSTVTLDTRLVAAVQAAAGARCHEAANLLQTYYMSTEACRVVCRRGDSPAAAEARALCLAAKVRLRDFLAERLLGWVTESPTRRLNRDHPLPLTPAN
jgi:hypothetical protein